MKIVNFIPVFWLLFAHSAFGEQRVISETFLSKDKEIIESQSVQGPLGQSIDETKSSPKEHLNLDFEQANLFGVDIRLTAEFLMLRSASSGGSDLIFDPGVGDIGLVGQSQTVELFREKSGTVFGLNHTKNRADGAIFQKDDPGGLIDSISMMTIVEVESERYGLFAGRAIREGLDFGSARFGVSSHSYDIDVREIVTTDLGILTQVDSVSKANTNSFYSFDLAVAQNVEIGSGWGLMFGQQYSHPLETDGYSAFSVELGLTKQLGSAGVASKSSRQIRESCKSLEIAGGIAQSSISASSASSTGEREVQIDDVISWRGESKSIGYRFGGESDSCHRLNVAFTNKNLDFRSDSSRSNSQYSLDAEGTNVRYSYLPTLMSDTGDSTYIHVGPGLFFGEAKTNNSVNYAGGSISSTDSDPVDLYLFDLSFGLGYRSKISDQAFLFYELSSSRYDGRPFGVDVYGWEHGLRAGLGILLQ